MKLNSRGQVTIPAKLRRIHGLRAGDELDVIDDGGTLRIVRSEKLTRGEEAVRRVRGILGPGLSADEVMALTRGD